MRACIVAVACILSPVAAAAHPAVGIVVDSQGAVFYSDTEHVWRIDPRGRRTVAVPAVHTHERWLDGEDNL